MIFYLWRLQWAWINIIYEKIPSLSAGQRKVAEYILNNKDEFSYATLAKLSKDISVSETTVIRFAYSLGFDSFSAMQQKLREEILSVPQRNVEGQIQNQTFYQKVFFQRNAGTARLDLTYKWRASGQDRRSSSECRSYSGNRSTLFLSCCQLVWESSEPFTW